ncbi:MAG: glycosyltransferase [Candidatus Electrothrix sp. YB6]
MMKKIIMLTTVIPQLSTGGEIYTSTLVKSLAKEGYSIDLVGYRRKEKKNDFSFREEKNVRIYIAGYRNIETKNIFLISLSWVVKSIVKDIPFSMAKYTSISYKKILDSLLSLNEYDLMIVDHGQMLWTLQERCIKKNKMHRKYYLINHNFEPSVYSDLAYFKKGVIKKLYLRESKKIKEYEKRMNFAPNNGATFISEKDRHLFIETYKNIDKKNTITLSPFVKKKILSEKFYYQSIIVRDICLFGNWLWEPNRKSLIWFFNRVVPLLPNIKIGIAGKGAEKIIPCGGHITYHGYIENIDEFILSSKCIAIPSILGSGVQIKSVESVNYAIPIVATEQAFRGINSPPSFVAVVKDHISFAKKISSVIHHTNTRNDAAFKEAVAWQKDREEKYIQSLKTIF